MERGVERGRIVGSSGRGPLADASVKDHVKRRVVVKLLTPATEAVGAAHARRKIRPGIAPVWSPPSITISPLTTTVETPTA